MNVDITTFQIFQAIKEGLLYPANEFMDDDSIINVCEKFRYNNSFFPIPLFISASLQDIKKIKNNTLNLSYKNKIIHCFFPFDSKLIIKSFPREAFTVSDNMSTSSN